jgi:transposase
MMGWTAPDGIMSAKLEVSIRSSTKGPSMTKVSMIGLDLGKNAFQVHAIDARGNVVVRKQLRRGQIEKFFAGLEPVIVGMEACGGAHHWGRMLSKLGHEVRMMPPAYVKAYRKRNKTDGRDAEAICDAMDRPTMRFIAVKSPESQAIAVVHSTRRLLVRQRTMSANGLRSALAEFGIVAAQGLKGLQALMQLLGDPATEIPDNARLSLQLLAQQWEVQNAQICKLDAEIVRAAKSDAQARRLMQIPGVGPIGATAIAAIVPGARVFKSARDQGNRTLRTLLILGATAYLRHERTHPRDPWLQALLVRRPVKVVAVALAAKIARIIWAMLVSGENYRPRRHAVAAQAA